MAEPAFLAIGDIHLDHLIWRRHRQINGDAYLGFHACLARAIDLRLPIVLVGDVFDVVDPEPAVVREFRRGMDRMAEAQLPVYTLQGNHDRRPVPWPTALHDWPQAIGDGQPHVIGGLTCRAFDYDTRDKIRDRLLQLVEHEPPQVLFLHQAIKQALRFEGQWNCDLEWVPEGVPLTILGDLHIHWQAQFRPGQYAYYTGATHPRDISQIGPKSLLQVHTDLQVTRLPIPFRPIARVQVQVEAELAGARKWLAEAKQSDPPLPPALFVTHPPELLPQVLALIAGEAKAIVVSEQLEVQDMEDQQQPEPEADGLLDIQTILQQLIDERESPLAYRLASRLCLSSDAVTDIIREQRQLAVGDKP